jgi:membrane associated rhomboid family serine protease
VSTTLWQDFRQQFLGSPSMATRLVAVNVIVFVLVNLVGVILWLANADAQTLETAGDAVNDYLGVPSSLEKLLYRPWTLITYAFTHQQFLHLLFNMLMLYWFGNILADFAGNKRILPVYILGALVGAVVFIAGYNLLPVLQSGLGFPMIGASAGVLAIVVAAATLVPDYSIVLFLIGPVKIKWLALAMVVIDVISLPLNNAGGHLAHLGGAFCGFLYITQLRRGRDFGKWIHQTAEYAANPKFGSKNLRTVHKSTNPSKTHVTSQQLKDLRTQEDQLDRILDKISQSGYESLTKDEKDFLFRYSNKT